MATRNCLVKVIDALYDLACTTILFIDKSVLTTNKMSASQIWIPSNQDRIISAAPSEDPNGKYLPRKTNIDTFFLVDSRSRMHANVRMAKFNAFSDPL